MPDGNFSVSSRRWKRRIGGKFRRVCYENLATAAKKNWLVFLKLLNATLRQGTLKGGSITVLLTSCLTDLESAV